MSWVNMILVLLMGVPGGHFTISPVQWEEVPSPAFLPVEARGSPADDLETANSCSWSEWRRFHNIPERFQARTTRVLIHQINRLL